MVVIAVEGLAWNSKGEGSKIRYRKGTAEKRQGCMGVLGVYSGQSC